jgi:hypothetical protein
MLQHSTAWRGQRGEAGLTMCADECQRCVPGVCVPAVCAGGVCRGWGRGYLLVVGDVANAERDCADDALFPQQVDERAATKTNVFHATGNVQCRTTRGEWLSGAFGTNQLREPSAYSAGATRALVQVLQTAVGGAERALIIAPQADGSRATPQDAKRQCERSAMERAQTGFIVVQPTRLQHGALVAPGCTMLHRASVEQRCAFSVRRGAPAPQWCVCACVRGVPHSMASQRTVDGGVEPREVRQSKAHVLRRRPHLRHDVRTTQHAPDGRVTRRHGVCTMQSRDGV